METLTVHNQQAQPRQFKAALYLRVNHPDKLHEGKHTKPQASKTALYCRVVSRHPNDVGAIQSQLDKLRDFAEQQGHTICKEYLDDGFSGNNLDRPAFAEMEVAINEGTIDTIIVRSLGHIARNFLLLEKWDEWRRRKGVQLIALDGSHEPTPFMKEIQKLIQRN